MPTVPIRAHPCPSTPRYYAEKSRQQEQSQEAAAAAASAAAGGAAAGNGGAGAAGAGGGPRKNPARQGGVYNHGMDDENFDYIVHEGEVFHGRYAVKETIGKGKSRAVHGFMRSGAERLRVFAFFPFFRRNDKRFCCWFRVWVFLRSLFLSGEKCSSFCAYKAVVTGVGSRPRSSEQTKQRGLGEETPKAPREERCATS